MQPAQTGSLADLLKNKEIPVPKKSGITKQWQDKAFRDMEYLGIELKPKDIGRVFKVYKQESEGFKHKGSIGRVISYLKDHPSQLGYDGKLKMFFKLVSSGFNN